MSTDIISAPNKVSAHHWHVSATIMWFLHDIIKHNKSHTWYEYKAIWS